MFCCMLCFAVAARRDARDGVKRLPTGGMPMFPRPRPEPLTMAEVKRPIESQERSKSSRLINMRNVPLKIELSDDDDFVDES